MKHALRQPRKLALHTLVSALIAGGLLSASTALAGPILGWQTVVNNTVTFPGDTRKFNSYNQPSVNDAGLVVFRARTKGGAGIGEPASGILTRDMATPGNPIIPIAVRGSVVPQPNNTGATFNEFPSIPRIDATSSMIATRGQSQPVLEYQNGVDPITGEPTTTRSGTSGIYTNPIGPLQTGMSGLGNVTSTIFPTNPDLSYFQVPNTTPGTKFDQFPGAPSPTGGDTIVFKGNWTEGTTGRTGVYFRDVNANGGASPVQLIADSKTDIPEFAGTKFGSTAPPSAANDKMVFLGLDNEAAPTKGGLYMATINNGKNPNDASVLETIVSIGQAVVDKVGKFFTRLGEALSFDGQQVAYWGAWGSKDSGGNLVTATRSVTVNCDSIENKKTNEFCHAQDNGTTPGSGTPGDGLYAFDVPVDQGFFITDVNTLETRLIAETGGDFLDFVYWNFSGKVPGAEDEEDGEPARWRSTSFIASDGWNAAFKGTQTDGDTGLYLSFVNDLFTIAETGMDGNLLDPMAAGLPIVSLGIERDGYRNGWLAINASMTNDVNSMAGIYIARVPEPGTLALLGIGIAGLTWRRRKQQRIDQ
jgi:hypothetical protein